MPSAPTERFDVVDCRVWIATKPATFTPVLNLGCKLVDGEADIRGLASLVSLRRIAQLYPVGVCHRPRLVAGLHSLGVASVLGCLEFALISALSFEANRICLDFRCPPLPFMTSTKPMSLQALRTTILAASGPRRRRRPDWAIRLHVSGVVLAIKVGRAKSARDYRVVTGRNHARCALGPLSDLGELDWPYGSRFTQALVVAIA
jgi:hypothetical protein